ncbi:MAG: hypothetical protein COB13_009860 [OCS116 cluster bacterium]|uniref:Flagellar protein FlgN n=1 Tax=OCS116 cluster bacterium TaxID=2030921 RepID=A0A2A4Z1C7_9PROT|nr:hypothetical protein [OCS116 cluster bacterium]
MQNNSNKSNALIQNRNQAMIFCTDMHEILARLQDILNQETARLRANDLTVLAELHEEKTQLIETYSYFANIFKSNRQGLSQYAPDKIAKLRIVIEHFQESLRRNHIAIDAQQQVALGIMETITRHVENKQRPTTYGNPMAPQNTQRQNRSTSLALNVSI